MNTKTAARVPSPEVVQQSEPQLPAVVEPQHRNGGTPKPYALGAAPQLSAPHIAKAIVGVMKEIGVVAKEGVNSHFNYSFAKMEDITKRLTPLMAKHGLAIIPSEVSRSFVDPSYISITYAFTIMHESGEVWPERPEYTGVSLAKSRSGVFDDKCANKCSTAARKYFLLALFQIPTGDDDDADKGSNDGAPQRSAKSRVPSPNDAPPVHAEPHAFVAKNAVEWTAKFLDYIAAAKTAAEVVAWDEINRNNLTQLAKADPARTKTVMNAMKARKAEFSTGEPVTTDGELPPKPKADGVPDAATEPEKFLAWADKAMGAAKTLEMLESLYNGEIETRAGGLFPPDKDELVGLFGKHERRFEA